MLSRALNGNAGLAGWNLVMLAPDGGLPSLLVAYRWPVTIGLGAVLASALLALRQAARAGENALPTAPSGMANLQGGGQIALKRLRGLTVDQLAEQIIAVPASWRLSCCTVSMRRKANHTDSDRRSWRDEY